MNFKELAVWQKSMNLALDIYEITKSFPKNEYFGLVSQIRRCSVSVPSNIAEGHGRRTTQTFINFLKISLGSLSELETQLILSFKLKYLEEEIFNKINTEIEEVGKMLLSFIRSLKDKTIL